LLYEILIKSLNDENNIPFLAYACMGKENGKPSLQIQYYMDKNRAIWNRKNIKNAIKCLQI
jgi:hypothetical protein